MFRLLLMLGALSSLFFMDNMEGVSLGIVGGLVSGIYNIAQGPGGEKEKKYLKEVRDLYRDMPLPEFERLIAPQLIQTGKITPEVYDAFIKEEEAPQIEEDPATREAQLRGLMGMEQVAQEGLPLQDRLRAQDAQRALAGELSRADKSVLSNLARRGRTGGGTELAARLATQGRAAETARGMGSDLAQQSIQNRLMALRAVPEMAGQIRGQDINKLAQNSAIQQRYNEFVSNLKTQAAANAAQQRNMAQAANLAERQRIADFNVMAPYQTAKDRDQQQQALFGANLQKTGGLAGSLGNLGQLASQREAIRRRQVDALGSGFDDLVGGIIKAKAGGAGGAGAGLLGGAK